MAERVSRIDEDKILEGILSDPDLQEKIIELNQKQMQAGKGADGASLPRYDQDLYFKTTKAAKAYEAWKAHISPNPGKAPGVMDFYIDGTYQSTIKIVNAAKAFTITTDSPIAKSIDDKTNNEALGLNDDSLDEIILIILDIFREKVYEQMMAA